MDMPDKDTPKLNRKEVKKLLKEILLLFNIDPIALSTKKKEACHIDPDSIKELIDSIRVCIKYNIFDIEALKREIKYLKKLCHDNEIDIL